MELEKQVCSLELAKKLKGLGVKQESLFYWCERTFVQDYEVLPILSGIVSSEELKKFKLKELEYKPFNSFSAFTVTELGEMLPTSIKKNIIEYSLLIDDFTSLNYFELLIGEIMEPFIESIVAETEADTRAKMLVYLIEQGVVKS